MKKYSKIILSSIFLGLALVLVACSGTKKDQKAKQNESTYSNLNNKKSVEEVKSLLSAHLDKDSVGNFVNLVNDYNGLVGSTGLRGEFTKFTKTEYDVEKINPLWQAKKGDFIGTNCRINTYTLLKNSIKIPQIKKDDELLFIDNDSIDKGKLFDAKDKEDFNILFSRVKTEATQDVKVHAKKMEEYFKQFKFNEKARMLSVIVHDNLDGDSLFVGHVGVLVPDKDGYLFIEKLTFEEPYQAIKFATKEDVYKYLQTKYKDYTGEGLAKPFIMDNDKWVEGK
ncbi:DUF4300 family protein [Streptococcus gordonii]|uniref:DUF4300 family protein n=1 Tax=Streptococcus TaxID=1301 RepID=UPI00065FB25F|nr:DUF4300 family protein [Streptococcus gordonii]MBZ2147437.1 DUF4300 family protein [Streptococcus gordonii]MCC3175593.1 hypothetical protein [Streptococcus gordonii]MCY7133509.1 DUF4300 family protein [Streptococcus gordonii]MCY7146255.1 DUF4300 family protein [Streptococcus gordonii]MCY7168320.1 DUF4300 family protein [Streptococcus gordonii]